MKPYKCRNCGGSECYEYNGHRHCKACLSKRTRDYRAAKRGQYAEYQRQQRIKTGNRYYSPEWYSRNKPKILARQAVYRAVRDGVLERKPCEGCGAVSSQAHHTDYSKPLDVHWLCSVCHGMEHAK